MTISDMSTKFVRVAVLHMSAAWPIAGFLAVLAAIVAVSLPSATRAETLQSNNFKFEESVLGGGGLIQSNSANYQTNGVTLGESIIGDSSSANYQFTAGNRTTNDPTLTVKLIDDTAAFGAFSSALPVGTTAKFSVINYTSSGYAVFISGGTPRNSGHSLPPMTSPTNDISAPGTEQFGMNLIANAPPESPLSFGENLAYGPFGKNGNIDDAYNDPGTFRYDDGHRIAYGSSSSGEAIYTVSYLINVSTLTPGGVYRSDQTLIVTGTF